jgi:hypothetical protein
MNHLTHEDFVLSYYGEPDLGDERRAHLESCAQCASELASLSAVLDRVPPTDVPEPAPDYESRVWDRVQWRMRGEGKRHKKAWLTWIAVAAMIVVAFLGGLLWNRRANNTPQQQIATTTTTTTQTPSAATVATQNAQQQQSRDRVLLVVVGEHFDESERVLVELTNMPSKSGTTDISSERARAEELLASNRIYRTSAEGRGAGDVATLLDELEPVLLQLAHAPSRVSAEELRAIQKRVEAKGLVFKLRVVRADVHREARTSPSTSI